MSADAGQLCFVYQTFFSWKARLRVRYCGATEQRDVWHMPPMEVGAHMCVRAAFVRERGGDVVKLDP